jgi:hypothetical protein
MSMRLSRRHLMSGFTGLLVAGPSHAASSATDEIIATERAFDAYTAVHGYVRGFLKYSTPDAVGFNPAIFPYHQQLAADLAKAPPETPSKLRWWPYRVGASRSGDFGFDLGGWTLEGKPGGGWFFTIWQKQADGGWLWPLDCGAGRTDDATLLPKAGDLIIHPLPSASAKSLGDIKTLDQAHNKRIEAEGPVKPVMRALITDASVSSANHTPATTPAAQIDILLKRPFTGYQTRGGGIATSGDLGYSYGECLDAKGAFVGSYMRLWHAAEMPRLLIDLYHPT